MEIEDSILNENVATDIGWALINDFAQQMRCMPDEVNRGAEILVERLIQAGLQPTVYNPEIYLGIPVSASIEVSGQTISCKASALSPAVGGLRASLIHLKAKPSQQGVHPGDPSNLFETQFATEAEAVSTVKDRIVLTEGLSNPARTQLLQSWGAAAVIVINPGDRSHWGTNSVVWGSPQQDEMDLLPKIASVAVSRAEGEQLLDAAKEGAQVTLDVDALHGWFKQPVVTVEVKGEGPEADDFVLLHSHYDSWEYGVGDNATGNAVVLEVARLLANAPNPLRRSVRFAWWPGHSAGRYAGSSWYADAFGAEMSRHCIAHVNCDSPGCTDATSYASIRSMTEAGPLLKRTVQELFGQECTITRPGRAGDYSFNNLGISGTMLTSSMIPKEERDRRGWYAVGGCGGSPAWHSEYDTMEVADRGVLENDIKLYGLMVARLANEARIPLEYSETLSEIRAIIAGLAPERLGVDVAADIDAALARCEMQLNVLASDANLGDRQWNKVHKSLSRILVRLSYAIGPSYVQDPAKSLRPIPLLSELSPNSAKMTPHDALAAMRAKNAVLEHLAAMEDILSATKWPSRELPPL